MATRALLGSRGISALRRPCRVFRHRQMDRGVRCCAPCCCSSKKLFVRALTVSDVTDPAAENVAEPPSSNDESRASLLMEKSRTAEHNHSEVRSSVERRLDSLRKRASTTRTHTDSPAEQLNKGADLLRRSTDDEQRGGERTPGARAFGGHLQARVARDIFMAFATDPGAEGTKHEPYLNTQDMRAVLLALGRHPTQKEIELLLEELDLDGNGTIELNEFLAGCDNILGKPEQDARLPGDLDEMIDLFRTLDNDGDGRLSVRDLTGLLSTGASCALSEEDASRMIAVADQTGDGSVNIREFVDMLGSSSIEKQEVSWRLRCGFRMILLIGGPGSGKGALAKRLVSKAGVQTLSSGQLLRDEVASGSALGKRVEATIKRGELVPSSTIMALVKVAMSDSPGATVILDGFPRSASNCQDLTDIVGRPEFALYLDVDEETMRKRVLKRGLSSGRSDDNLETIRKRIKTFKQQGKPTVKYLEGIGIPIYKLDARKSPDEIWLDLLALNTSLTRRVL